MARGTEHDLLGYSLNRCRDIHLPLRQGRFRLSGGATEESVELPRRHREALAIVEIGHVEPKGPILLEVQEVLKDQLDVSGLTVRRQPHEFVFSRVHLESAEMGERRI